MDPLRPRMAFLNNPHSRLLYRLKARALRFQRGRVMRLNQAKKNPKQKRNVVKAESMEKALLTTAKVVNIVKAKPPKHRVMRLVSLKDISTSGRGRRNEKGHQMKSMSVSQLWKRVMRSSRFI